MGTGTGAGSSLYFVRFLAAARFVRSSATAIVSCRSVTSRTALDASPRTGEAPTRGGNLMRASTGSRPRPAK